jgi:uncharacterized protein (DUF58 family)
VNGTPSPRLRGLLGLAGVGVVAGLASGRPELVVLAAPLLVFIGVGLALAGDPQLTATLELERSRVLEGDEVGIKVTLHNDAGSGVEVDLSIVASRQLVLQPAGTIVLRLAAGSAAELALKARPERWGSHALGPLIVRARDPFGLVTWDRRLGQRLTLRAFPREQRLRELVAPMHTQPFLGTHVARARGEGIEFAEIRPFAAGDRVRHVNWHATARRGALHVTERHPERASDVVLLLDTFAEARDGATGTLDAAVRAAASLARGHLARRDRVALVDFGGTLHWLTPAFGTTQLYRIIDALLASEIAFSYAWRAVESIPRRVLPPGALILTVSPLLDERSIALIIELRTRARDLAVIEVSPLAHTPPRPAAADKVAHQLWRLQRQAMRARLRALGIAVAVWNDDDGGLGPALEGVNLFRRSARPLARV